MVGDLAVTHVVAVEPYVETGIHALKVQKRARRFRIPVPRKAVQIGAAGVVLGDIRRVKRKRIANVGVLGTVVASQLPAERHRLLFPPLAGLIIRQIEKILQIVDARIKGKAPLASAQHLQAVRTLPVPDHHVVARRRRHVVSPPRLGVLVKDREIFIKSLNDQNRNPLSIDLYRFKNESPFILMRYFGYTPD